MPFFFLVQPYCHRLLFALSCVFLTNILALCLPWGMKVIIDDVLKSGDALFLGRILGFLVLILCARTLLAFLQKQLSNATGERIMADLRQRFYEHAQRLSLRDTRGFSPSQLLARLTGDVESVRRFIFSDALDFIYSVFGALGIVGLLFWMNPRLAGIALVTVPFFVAAYYRFLPRLKQEYNHLRDEHGRLNARMSEVLSGIMTVRAFGGEAQEAKYLKERQNVMVGTACRAHALNAGLWIGVEFFAAAGALLVLWIGGLDVIKGRMTTGALVAFYSYLGMLFAPLIRMTVVNGSYQEALAALARINEVLDLPADVAEKPDAVCVTDLKGSLVFDRVSFGYGARPVLQDVSFTVEPGEILGIIGPSGAGKSTLVGLLLRFFDPQEGRILVDGRDLKALHGSSYRRQVSAVLQDDFLFQDTVYRNIVYGTTGVSLDAALDAARIAGAHEFIESLPEGYDAFVGERGAQLSSGQRQRLAIARALVRDPSVLILDEATSAVDAMTENKIQRGLRERMAGKTVLIVAHRFSTIMEADRVVVLEGGRITGIGTHEKLLAECAFYRQLYQEQFKGAPAAA